MTEISKLSSLSKINLPQQTTSSSGSNSDNIIFGDNIIGGAEDSYTSDYLKTQIKNQAQDLVNLAKRMSLKQTVELEGEENLGEEAIKKSIETRLKSLQDQAKMAGLDLSAIFSEIAEETNMSKRDQKAVQKTLNVKIERPSQTTLSTPSQQMPSLSKFANPFGALSGSSLTNTPSAASGSPTPTVNPSYNKSPSVKLDKAFLDKTKAISERIGCDYKDLLAVMNSESGLKANARNPKGGATGLIQFMPSTAKALGTTTEELAKMSPTQQLDYVEKFFNMIKKQAGMEGKKLSGADLYSLVFLPGRAKRDVLTAKGENFYAYNKGLDLDKDGNISKADLARRVAACHVNESKVFGVA